MFRESGVDMLFRFSRRTWFAAVPFVFLCASITGWAGATGTCQNAIVSGEISAGQEWRAEIGEGWVFRIVPIPPGQAGYTGWDLVVDREKPASFPDALYLATPPYGSINEREIGTTFGLRAQDAIGWNPRSFRFFADPKLFAEAQKRYEEAFGHAPGSPGSEAAAAARLLELQKSALAGELKIVDARLTPGTADPVPFAQQWAAAASRSGYQIESAAPGQSSARGAMRWMRFRLTLWLPSGWSAPRDLHPRRAPCGQ
jgi:hypothetical protein